MMRYVVLNLLVIVVTAVMVYAAKPSKHTRKNMLQTAVIMMLFTAVFDPLIIHFGIVAYNREFTLGINIFGAPIEDFAYSFVAGFLAPLLWSRYEKNS